MHIYSGTGDEYVCKIQAINRNFPLLSTHNFLEEISPRASGLIKNACFLLVLRSFFILASFWEQDEPKGWCGGCSKETQITHLVKYTEGFDILDDNLFLIIISTAFMGCYHGNAGVQSSWEFLQDILGSLDISSCL